MARPKKPEIQYEVEDAADVEEDTVYMLCADGEVRPLEVKDDDDDDPA